MYFQQSISTCISKFKTLQGRASRSEYWWWTLAATVLNVLAGVVDQMTGLGIVGLVVGLALLLPSVSVMVRRLHDLDRSGWFALLALIPVLGGLVLLYWFVQRGTEGDNSFGADPLANVA